MSNTTPLTQAPLADLHAALEIADTWTTATAHHDPEMSWRRIQYEFEDIARLMRDALAKLGDPHPHTVELTRRYLEASWGRDVTDQEAEDFVRIVVTSALKWSEP